MIGYLKANSADLMNKMETTDGSGRRIREATRRRH